MIFASVRDRWFDRTRVMISRPLNPDQFGTFHRAMATPCTTVVVDDGAFGDAEALILDAGEATGGESTWVPRWRVRQYERAGWVRGLRSWPIP